jgi:hypothetical protein
VATAACIKARPPESTDVRRMAVTLVADLGEAVPEEAEEVASDIGTASASRSAEELRSVAFRL